MTPWTGSVTRPRAEPDRATGSDRRTRQVPHRRPGSPSGSTWRVPAALVILSVVPVVAGSLRLLEVAGGPQLIPTDPRVDAPGRVAMNPRPTPRTPACYELRVQGHLDEHWSAWFGGLTLVCEDDGTTTLRGAVTDQAELYGLLAKIRDLGAPLLSVNSGDAADKVDDGPASRATPQPRPTVTGC
jgi:hypothetical protein